jgi:predicted dienelactone hydrolase
MRNYVWLPLLALAGCAAPRNITHTTIAGRDVAVWKPSGGGPASGFPVIVFSHGYSGCNTQSTFLMEALAHAGYLVVAPNHADARCGSAMKDWYPGKYAGSHPEEPFGRPMTWSDATYKDRGEDIRNVLDAVFRSGSFQGVTVDAARVGIAGHSLGGYTALGVAGAWPSWKDKRIGAVLALSPYCNPFVAAGTLGHLDVPVMYQGGTRDFGITPEVKKLDGAYDASPVPKYFVNLEGAGHLAWTNLNRRYQEVIDQYAIAFFDHYLKAQTNPDPLAPLIVPPFPARVAEVRANPN